MNLQNIRAKIDQLDSQILGLLNERMRLVTEIGRLKREQSQSVFAPEREELLLQTLDRQNRGPLTRLGLRAIYREIFSASRASQSQLTIAYVGSELSTTFHAARMRFGASDSYLAEPEWPLAVQALMRGKADVLIVPRTEFCQTLAVETAKKTLSEGVRVCGEINFMRVLKPEPGSLNSPKNPAIAAERFYLISCSKEIAESAGKSLIYLAAPGQKAALNRWRKMLENEGGRLVEAYPLAPYYRAAEGCYLCEVEDVVPHAEWQKELQRLYSPSTRLTMLGSYPKPPLYG